MELTVIIPTYKPGDYLWTCLESLEKQTYPLSSFEVLIVLNGCCEPWKSSIESYLLEHRDLNVTFIQTDQPGVSNARNIGIENANGEYLTFLDDDDYVSEEYLEELADKVSEEIISISYTLSFSESKLPYSYHITEAYNKVKNKGKCTINNCRSYFSGPCMKLFHKNIIGNRRFNTKLANGEDTLFMFEISDRIKKISLTTKQAVYYRRMRENSATTGYRTLSDKRKSDVIQLKAILKSFLHNPFGYNWWFCMTRVIGCIYYIIKPA